LKSEAKNVKGNKGIPEKPRGMPRQEEIPQNNMFDKNEHTGHGHQYDNSNTKVSIYEYLMGGFVVLFLINWYFGKSQNDSLAMKWFNANKSFFTYNYAHIGHDNNYSKFNMNSPFL
jgi:Protein of unknown function (DUF1682)